MPGTTVCSREYSVAINHQVQKARPELMYPLKAGLMVHRNFGCVSLASISIMHGVLRRLWIKDYFARSGGSVLDRLGPRSSHLFHGLAIWMIIACTAVTLRTFCAPSRMGSCIFVLYCGRCASASLAYTIRVARPGSLSSALRHAL